MPESAPKIEQEISGEHIGDTALCEILPTLGVTHGERLENLKNLLTEIRNGY